jgi:DEAD/DEAH box helicase domain-containing protein
MKEIPFGIEFYKEVAITESNLGRIDVVDSRKVNINENEVPAHGFITCRHCGKSSSNIRQKVNGKEYKFHYGYCKHKDTDYKGIPDDVFEEIFFFREMQTEALKILLPVQELDSDAEIKMFQAGIELGLKKYFKGNPQHVRLAVYHEYNHVTSKFDRYLVLFDSIPGGTGYLEKLFNANAFSELLRIAYDEIRKCSCQHENKDGCYRCIYSYSNQYHQKDLSRIEAEKRFAQIIKRSEDWEYRTNGLGNLTNTGNIEESELEERFIRSLKNLANTNQQWGMEEVNDDGTISYVLTYKDDVRKLGFHIRPQVNLGRTDGIEFHTRSDFLFICTHCEVNGNGVEDKSSLPRFAVYLDGYQFHASKEHNSFLKDFEKRKAIAVSKSHYSWTLTWDDVEIFDAYLGKNDKARKVDFLEDLLTSDDGFKQSKSALLKAVRRDVQTLKGYENNFIRFLETLKTVDDLTKAKGDISLFFAFFQKKLFTPSHAPDKYQDALENNTIDTYCVNNKTLDGLIPVAVTENNSLVDFKLAVNIDKKTLIGEYVINDLETIDKKSWGRFWILFNLFQFFDFFQADKQTGSEEQTLNIEDIVASYETELKEIVQKIYDAGMLKSEEDEIKLNSLLDSEGNVLAEAELIIDSVKTVYGPYSEEDKAVFIKEGYIIVSKEKIKDIEI